MAIENSALIFTKGFEVIISIIVLETIITNEFWNILSLGS